MAISTAGGGPFSTGPKMNVTPLIDVLLVLIIVFMLVVIEQKPVGLQTEIPQQPKSIGPSIPPPLTTIVIQIHHAKPGFEHPRVMVNEETVDWDHLRRGRQRYRFPGRGGCDCNCSDRRRRPRGAADR